MAVSGPLSGIVVCDLTRVLAGPFCTMIMADLGARVIKVETPGAGDDARTFNPFTRRGKSAYFMSLNRGKESIALNLKDDADRAVLDRLLNGSDVLVENFRPGTMERLGYGWDAVHARFPRLIYAAASGFGHTGPYSKRPAYDLVAQAMGGLMSVTGEAGGQPTRIGASVGDITAGLFTAIGVNAALFNRSVTGTGMKVDVAMLDCQVALIENHIVRYSATGEVGQPVGSRSPSITPFAAFRARDGHLIIAAGNDALFRRLCQTLGRADLADNPLFTTNALRTQHHAALAVEIEQALAERDVDEWFGLLEAAGIPCGPINSVDKVVNDPQVQARAMVVSTDDPVGGPLLMAGNPIKMSPFADPTTRPPAPELDADRERILRDFP